MQCPRAHTCVQVPSVLLLFSHLRPQELVRPQPSDGLREDPPEASFETHTREGSRRQLLMNLS